MSQRAAKTSRILTDGNALTFASWNVDEDAQDLDTVNFESWNTARAETYDEGLYGVLGAKIRFGGDWDASANPFDSPPGLYIRDDLSNTFFYESRIDSVFYEFPYIRLRGTSNGAEVRGKVLFSCSGMNQGPYDRPTGSA